MVMPYVDGVVAELLRRAFTGSSPAVTVTTMLPAQSGDRMPLVVARTVGGTGVRGSHLAQMPTIQIDAYAHTRRDAGVLCEQARAALAAAARSTMTTTSDGTLQSLRDVSTPAEIREPDQPDRWSRWTCTVRVVVRS